MIQTNPHYRAMHTQLNTCLGSVYFSDILILINLNCTIIIHIIIIHHINVDMLPCMYT